MSKKKKIRKATKARAPVMIALLLHPEVELAERLAVDALTQDYAAEGHFNTLWDCNAMMIFSLKGKPDMSANAITEMASIALESIHDRYYKHKVVRATGDELHALRAMVEFSSDYWRRQGGGRFEMAYKTVNRCKKLYEAERKAA